jgi:uncharacterized membrane protein YphA (DoxX/SURF4 family)
MKQKLSFIARIVLGLIFFVFGLNGFLQFIPVPEMSPGAGNLMGAFVESGYLMIFVKITEVVCGLLLLIGRFVPLSLVILAPVTLNIVLFHLFLDMAGMPMGIVLLALQIFVMYCYRDSYRDVLKAKA